MLFHWILYCNFWFLGIRNSKIQRSTCFVKIELIVQKSWWREFSIGEFFLNMQQNQCGEKCTSDHRISEYPLKCCLVYLKHTSRQDRNRIHHLLPFFFTFYLNFLHICKNHPMNKSGHPNVSNQKLISFNYAFWAYNKYNTSTAGDM